MNLAHLLTTINRIKISCIVVIDVPGPPLNIEVLDWDKDYVDLTWEAPRTDGGAPILKYIIG